MIENINILMDEQSIQELTQQNKNGSAAAFAPNQKLEVYVEELTRLFNYSIDFSTLYSKADYEIIYNDELVNVYEALLKITLRAIKKNEYDILCSLLTNMFKHFTINQENASYFYFVCEYASKYINSCYYQESTDIALINLCYISFECICVIKESNQSISLASSDAIKCVILNKSIDRTIKEQFISKVQKRGFSI